MIGREANTLPRGRKKRGRGGEWGTKEHDGH